MRSALLSGALALALHVAGVAGPSDRQLVAQLNADLLSHDSATATLQRWCAVRRLADPPTIVARRVLGENKPADAEVRGLLHAAPGEPIRYRRVALACGDHVLSNADNWYRPGALTAQMNAELGATDHPFGAVVKPLEFHRQTLSAAVLYAADDQAPPAAVIRHKALLETPDGTPFSLVVETYAKAVLDAGPEGPGGSAGQKVEPKAP